MAKIAEVKINRKTELIQIKMNKGPNYTVEREKFDQFIERVEFYMDSCQHSEACRRTAGDYINGEL
jgi:hypothetical protein